MNLTDYVAQRNWTKAYILYDSLYEVQEQAELIYGVEVRIMVISQGKGLDIPRKGHKGNFWGMEMFYSLI